jgi:hypothetical protein
MIPGQNNDYTSKSLAEVYAQQAQGGFPTGYAQAAIQPRDKTGAEILLSQIEQMIAFTQSFECRLGAMADRTTGPVPQATGTNPGDKVLGGGGYAHQIDVRLTALLATIKSADDHLTRLERFL